MINSFTYDIAIRNSIIDRCAITVAFPVNFDTVASEMKNHTKDHGIEIGFSCPYVSQHYKVNFT